MSDVEMAPEPEPLSAARPDTVRRAGLIVAVVAIALGGVGMTYTILQSTMVNSAASRADAAETEPSFSAAGSTSVPTTTTPPTTTTSTTSTTTSTSTSTTTTTTTMPLQQTAPIAPPSDPHGAENLGELGSISIPRIGLTASLNEGIRLTTLDRGPGHWPGSAMPGQVGNVVVAAHRTSHGAQFRHIDQLVPGDIVTFSTVDGVFDYQVTGTQIVSPDAVWIIDPTDTPTATLFACHPPGSTRQRIVVSLALV